MPGEKPTPGLHLSPRPEPALAENPQVGTLLCRRLPDLRYTFTHRTPATTCIRALLMSNNSFLTHFEPMLEALDASFAFLVDEHGFEKTPPEQCGRECVVNYFRAPFVDICIMCEPFSAPFIVVTVKPGELDVKLAHAPLRLAAKKRDPGWVEPRIEREGSSEPEFRPFFDNYAALLKESFADLLTVGTPEFSAVSAGAKSASARNSVRSTGFALRLWGAAIAAGAFLAIVLEIRYFTSVGLPAATGSVWSNWGILLLIGLPWAAMVAGFLQIISGTSIRHFGPGFDAMTLRRRLGISIGAVALSVICAGLAVAVASG